MSAVQQVLFIKGVSGVTYATWNPSDKHASITLTNGNLTLQQSAGNQGVRATIGKTTGKWYWEYIQEDGAAEADVGIATSSYSLSTWLGNDAHGVGYDSLDGKIYKSGSAVGTGGSAWNTNGNVIGIALDADIGEIKIYRSNILQYTYSTGLTAPYYPASGGFGASKITANFGATALTYTPPSGYNAGMYT